MLPTVVVSGGAEKHSPVRCHSDGHIELRLQIAATYHCAFFKGWLSCILYFFSQFGLRFANIVFEQQFAQTKANFAWSPRSCCCVAFRVGGKTRRWLLLCEKRFSIWLLCIFCFFSQLIRGGLRLDFWVTICFNECEFCVPPRPCCFAAFRGGSETLRWKLLCREPSKARASSTPVMVELLLWLCVGCGCSCVCCANFALELRYFLATIPYEPIRLWNDGLLLCSRTALSFGN